MDGKIIQEPAQVQSGATPANYCTRTATFGSTIGGQGTAGMYCPFYPRLVVLRVENLCYIGSEGLMGSIIGNVSDIRYTYTDSYIRADVYGVQSSTRYILTAFG